MKRPPIPTEASFTSPLRHERLSARVGTWISVAFGLCFVTGIISHWYYLRDLPSRARAIVTAGLIVLVTVTITAVPVLGSWGARSDNPTLLDRNYVLGWLVFAILVVVGSLVRFTPAWSRLVHRGSTDDGSA